MQDPNKPKVLQQKFMELSQPKCFEKPFVGESL